jgi:trimeric autotransporter adhesin
MKKRNIIAVLSALVCVGLCQQVQAAPAPETPDPGSVGGSLNTADGTKALGSVTTGIANSAFGWFSLSSNTDGSFNTGCGAGALDLNVGNQSTGEGVNNTAVGGAASLLNSTGSNNVAVGTAALELNTAGPFNTAVGFQSLVHATANANTAVGDLTLINLSSGFFNVALGAAAGFNSTTGHNNIYIGQGSFGVAGESNSCYIQSIFGQPIGVTGVGVGVDSDGKLGTFISTRRVKRDIKPMDKASEVILALKPVTFHYKTDATNTPFFGLVAEDVAQVNPNLVVRDKQGELVTVRYEQINAMLLNEFLKEHKKVEEQQASISQLKSEMQTMVTQLKEQAAQIQKVSAQLQVNKPAPQVVANKP